MTSACYDHQRNYSEVKPIIKFIQDCLVQQNLDEALDISDCILGIEAIMHCGGRDAIKDFMAYNNIEMLIEKLITFYSSNIKTLLLVDRQPNGEDFLHQTYPSISMVS